MSGGATFGLIQTVIRPHQLFLLGVFYWAFNPKRRQPLTRPYMLHIHRFLISELSEVSRPKSFDQLINDISKGSSIDADLNQDLIQRMRELSQVLSSPYSLSDFLMGITIFYSPSDPDVEAFIERKSFFGAFLRRMWVTYRKMSFDGVSILMDDFRAWASGDQTRGYQKLKRQDIKHDDVIVAGPLDKELFPQTDAFEEFEKSQANGDQLKAAESLRRFYEQRFDYAEEPILRQHAAFHLARMYYGSGQYTVAKKILLEASSMARTAGDNIMLQRCMSLLRRIPPPPEQPWRWPLNEVQPEVSAMEILFDVYKIHSEEQPVADSFEKVFQALAVYDLSSQYRENHFQDDQWKFHVMQAIIWRLTGCERLAVIEESICLGFSESGRVDDARLYMIINRANALARQGKALEAFCILLDVETWRSMNLTFDQPTLLANAITSVMALSASRQEHRPSFDFLRNRKFGHPAIWDAYSFANIDKKPITISLDSTIYRVLQARSVNQAPTCIEYLLQVLWQLEYVGEFRLHRIAITLLADSSLEFGMTVKSRRLMEEVMPQIINGDDRELRAFACFVLARCIIACCGKNFDGLHDAIPYLDMAEIDYRALEMHTALQDILYTLATVYHNLGMEKERDEAASRHQGSVKEQNTLHSLDVNDGWFEILDLVSNISIALTNRQ